MKKVRKKKNKPKKKWEKRVGDFLFKHITITEKNGTLTDVYFKEEFIGLLGCSLSKHSHNVNYVLNIYSCDDNHKLHVCIGEAICCGTLHGLPRTILRVDLKGGYSMLTLERNVLIEKLNILSFNDLVPDITRFYRNRGTIYTYERQ